MRESAVTFVSGAADGANERRSSFLGNYAELAKARLSALVVLTTAAGFALAAQGALDWMRLFWTLLGTSLAAAGANAFNQFLEIEADARMRRTCRRPLPAQRVRRGHALAFALAMSLAGPLLLAVFVNPLTALLGAACLLIYVLVYTPMKRQSPLNTLVGAIVGALPPMMGWTAATGRLDFAAWLLGAILFLWQIPHFLALAWLYRDDYERGGFRMIPRLDRTGQMTAQVALLYTLALVSVTLFVPLAGLAGRFYAVGATVLNVIFVVLAVRMLWRRDDANARRLFLASVLYLPLLLGLMVADKRWMGA